MDTLEQFGKCHNHVFGGVTRIDEDDSRAVLTLYDGDAASRHVAVLNAPTLASSSRPRQPSTVVGGRRSGSTDLATIARGRVPLASRQQKASPMGEAFSTAE